MTKSIFLTALFLLCNPAWADDMQLADEIPKLPINMKCYFPNDLSSEDQPMEATEAPTVPAAQEINTTEAKNLSVEEPKPDTVGDKQAPIDKLQNRVELQPISDTRTPNELIAAADIAFSKEQILEARKLFTQAVVKLQELHTQDKVELAKALNKLASTYDLSDLSERKEAQANYKKALSLNSGNKNIDADTQADSLSGLSIIEMANGQLKQAEIQGKRSLEVRKEAFGSDAPQTGESFLRLAIVIQSRNRAPEAEPLAQQSKAIFEKANDSKSLAASLSELVNLHVAQKDLPEAEKLCMQQLSVLEASNLRLPVADCLEQLGTIQKALGKDVESQANFARALELREAAASKKIFRFIEGSPNCTNVLNNGAFIEQVEVAGLQVAAGIEPIGDKIRADLRISNSGNKQVDIIPGNIKLIVVRPQSKEYKQVNVDQWAASIVRNVRLAIAAREFCYILAASAAGACASMPTAVPTSSYSYGSMYVPGYGSRIYSGTTYSTTYVPNYNGQRAVQNMARRHRRTVRGEREKLQMAKAQAQSLQQTALRTCSVLPMSQVEGNVYFVRNGQFQDAILQFELDGSTYQFPFHSGTPISSFPITPICL